MRRPKTKPAEQIARNQQVSLLELLDRLLDKGVMVQGEVLLSVADIDLIYLNLGLLLSSVKTVEQAAGRDRSREAPLLSWHTSPWREALDEPQLENSTAASPALLPAEKLPRKSGNEELTARILPASIEHGPGQLFEPKASIDPKNVEKGLAGLVLTLVDLIRQLMEKQAIRRIDAGQLHTSEIERMGNAFFLLDEKLEQLKKTFGLNDEDLNIDLGPLGDLI